MTYFGQQKIKSEVIADKTRFVRRWPERNYEMLPDASANCPTSEFCTVGGNFGFRAHSFERATTSEGLASFELGFEIRGEQISLVIENSQVISKEIRNRDFQNPPSSIEIATTAASDFRWDEIFSGESWLANLRTADLLFESFRGRETIGDPTGDDLDRHQHQSLDRASQSKRHSTE